MWAYIAIILFSTTGIFCVSSKCFSIVTGKCDLSVVPHDVPKTVEELDKVCREVPIYGDCALDVAMTCDDEYPEDIENLREDVKFIRKSCDRDSPIYQAISTNLLCIGDKFETVYDDCNQTLMNTGRLNLLSDEKESLKREEYGDHVVDVCMHKIWESTCVSFMIGEKCGGEQTRDAIHEFMLNLDFFLENCVEILFSDDAEFEEAAIAAHALAEELTNEIEE